MIVAVSTRAIVVGRVKRSIATVQLEQRRRIVICETLPVVTRVVQSAEGLLILRLLQVLLVGAQHATFGWGLAH